MSQTLPHLPTVDDYQGVLLAAVSAMKAAVNPKLPESEGGKAARAFLISTAREQWLLHGSTQIPLHLRDAVLVIQGRHPDIERSLMHDSARRRG